MKKLLSLPTSRLGAVCLGLWVLVGASGCDAVRGFLDMPTRAQVQALRVRAAELQTAQQQAAEAALQARAAEETEVAEAPTGEGQTGEGQTAPGQMWARQMSANQMTDEGPAQAGKFWQYYLVAGSFRLEENAHQLVERLRKSGFEAQTLPFRSGSTVVTVGGFDSYEPAAERMEELKQLPLFADGLWLYNARRALHIE